MHDSCDSVSTNTQTTRYEFDANTRTAVGLATSLKDSGDLDGETLISRFSCAWHTAEPCVISAARNTKHTAERRDWKAVAFTMDEHEPHRFLLAKNSVALFWDFQIHEHALVLTPQAHELLTLLCCQCAGGSIAGVDLGKAHPFAQCVLADVEIRRDAKGSCNPRSDRGERPLL